MTSNAKLTIKIVGDKAGFTYDGQAHAAKGYFATCENDLFDESKIVFTGCDEVIKTEIGTYAMGLKSEQFSYNDAGFENVKFNVTDGELKINIPIRYYKLFDILQRRGMKKTDLLGVISSPTLAKLVKGETVRTDVIYYICVALGVQPGDIMEIVDESDNSK